MAHEPADDKADVVLRSGYEGSFFARQEIRGIISLRIMVSFALIMGLVRNPVIPAS
jgi:hypothetical protein